MVRTTRAEDFDGIVALCDEVYPGSPAWSPAQLASHLAVFAEGQLVAVAQSGGEVVGMAASLIVLWEDYSITTAWRDFTDGGTFTNHDPTRGRTLYAAEVMVDPRCRRMGVGGALYAAREALVRRLGLLRIRAGARLRGYHRYADCLTAEAYVAQVVRGELYDPTLSFQLHRGFRVIGTVSDYLRHDPESLGHAAVIEWLNPEVAETPGASRPKGP
jgi:GNAT superfamily N-acetyltransferase